MLLKTRPNLPALSVVMAGVVILLLFYDTNWLKYPIEHIVTTQTGREFRIEGNFRLRPGWPTRVHVERVRFANPEWAVEKQMLQLERADFRIKLFRLLLGEVIIPEAHTFKPQVDLELGPNAVNNWTLGGSNETEGGAVPTIGLLTVDQGVLTFHDPAHKTALRLNVSTAADAKSGKQGLVFALAGKLKNLATQAEGTGGPLLSINDRTTAYPLQARFRVGPTHGSTAGSITGLTALAAMNLWLDVGGESLAELFPLLGVTLPPTPPYHIKGRLLHDGEYWRMHDFAGRVGDSDLSGDVGMRYGESTKRVYLTANVTSKLLDLDDLGGVIGAPVQTGAGETSSAKQKQEAAQASAQARVLPDKPWNLERLRAMDANIRFTGKTIRRSKLPLEDVQLHVKLEKGLLTADPLDFGVAGGHVISKIKADARKKALAVDSDIRFRRIQLPLLYPESELLRESTGLIGGRAVLKGQGNTFADLVAHANGTFGLAMRGGQLSALLVEFVGLDAAEVLKFIFAGDKPVKISCAVTSFDVKNGVMQTRSAVIDTTDTNIHMDGTVNLANEAIDLTVHPLPKDWSPLALRSPIHLRGSFKNPDVSLDQKAFIKGGIAAVLAAIAGPLAALIPLIETGPGDDVNCKALVAAAKQHARMQALPPETPSPPSKRP